MIEIELFYKMAEARIRELHTKYLELLKREAVPVALPAVDELPNGEDWKKLNIFDRWKLKDQRKKQLKARKKAEKKQIELRTADKLLKGYNAGVKMSLNTLSRVYTSYNVRFDKD
jgi:hypothetical protein